MVFQSVGNHSSDFSVDSHHLFLDMESYNIDSLASGFLQSALRLQHSCMLKVEIFYFEMMLDSHAVPRTDTERCNL